MPEAAPVPGTDPWAEHDGAAMRRMLQAARRRARAEGKRVLLEFVAPWCGDCREVVRVMGEPAVQRVLRARYVLVPVNVGRFDQHRDLIRRYRVKRIATLVVLDDKGGALRRTTLEPLSSGKGLTAAGLLGWLGG